MPGLGLFVTARERSFLVTARERSFLVTAREHSFLQAYDYRGRGIVKSNPLQLPGAEAQ